MKNHFAIAPWEHPGADFDPAPHAQTRLEVGGKKRTFWLKMRDRVIFFRDASRAPLYAVPHLFEPELALDTEALVWQWKREVERGNYGAFFTARRTWPRTPASANYCIILRADGSGWIQEHFDQAWQDFSLPFAQRLDLWCSKPSYTQVSEAIVGQMAPGFLGRSVEAKHFETVAPHWAPGSSEQLTLVLRSAAQLWMTSELVQFYSGKPLEWRCRSNSAFLSGGVMGELTYTTNHRFNTVWDIVKWHCGFVGIEWKRASDHPELRARYGPRVWKRHFDRFGDSWRGNWIGQPFEARLSMAPLSPPSHHDKLEAALVLREFLRDQMPADKLNLWLQEGLR